MPSCRVCGCTDDRACVTADGPCHWVAPDLCSACGRTGRPRCFECADVGQLAITLDEALVNSLPHWVVARAQEAHPLPYICACPQCELGRRPVRATMLAGEELAS